MQEFYQTDCTKQSIITKPANFHKYTGNLSKLVAAFLPQQLLLSYLHTVDFADKHSLVKVGYDLLATVVAGASKIFLKHYA